jgi:hypothetical protein
VLDEQHGDALPADLGKHPRERLELLGADSGRRLVDEQNLRLGGQDGGEADQAALRAARRRSSSHMGREAQGLARNSGRNTSMRWGSRPS